MKASIALLAVWMFFGLACAETAEPAPEVERKSDEVAAAANVEAAREATERRLQLERSIDQWWLAYERQEFGKAEGLATHIETYVNAHYDVVAGDLTTASPRFRKVAAMALGFSGRKDAVPGLMGALTDPFSDVIMAALLSLSQLAKSGTDVPTEPIVPYLSHSDEDIRSNASLVLVHATRKGQSGLFLPLTSALEDASPNVRVHAAAALGALGDADAVPFLTKTLDDAKALVRIRAAYALGRIGDRRAVPRLIDKIDDPDSDVSKASHKALRDITGQEISRVKRDWETYWDSQKAGERR